VGAGSIASSTEDETHKKIEWIKTGAGERFNDIELETATYFISVQGRSEITAESVMARTGMELAELKRFPHAAVGSVDEICEELERRREEYGFSYITVGDAHLDAYLPIVERLAGK
jgi:alkanesulfonate monooxygenase SsuD/methylene tetrahydromethanopterin reductase-like flavin-dependent oxidoreductase (luciferase family)